MGAVPFLNVFKDGEAIDVYPIEGETVLGRGEGCVIRLDDRAISRQHAVFRKTADGIQVEKRSEFAPLKVNGSDCTSALVREGDVINIGPYLLKVKLEEQETKADGPVAAPVAESLEPPIALPSSSSGSEPAPEHLFVLPVPEAVSPLDATVAAPANILAPAPEFELNPEIALNHDGPEIGSDHQPLTDQPGPPEVYAPVTPESQTQANAGSELKVLFIFPEGAANFTQFDLNRDEALIGRDQGCDVVLTDKKSSRKHLLVRRAGVNFTIKDLGSANGTYVNGQKITERELNGGDKIRIGSTEFTFQAGSADYSQAAKDFLPVNSDEPTRALSPGEVTGASSEPAPSFELASSSVPSPAIIPQAMPGALDMGAVSAPNTALGAEPQVAIPGITGIPGSNVKKSNSLIGRFLEWFRALPKGRQYIWIFIICGLIYLGLFYDEEPEKAPAKAPQAQASPAAPNPSLSGAPTSDWKAEFARLTAEKKEFVRQKHRDAWDFFKRDRYDDALNELAALTRIIPEYEDSRELQRMCEDSKRKLEIRKEEERKKAEAESVRKKIADKVQEAAEKMDKKEYVQARELFLEIKQLEPENPQVQVWEKQIQDFEAEEAAKAQRERVVKQVNESAWKAYREAAALKAQGHYHGAIRAFEAPEISAGTDKVPAARARAAIVECRRIIAAARDPLMEEGKQQESAQEWSKAYDAYSRAAKADPGFRPAYEGMDRARKILHERAKVSYTEAVIAESYSDFDTATLKYKEVLTIVPADDLYYERATHKLSRLFVSVKAKAAGP